MVSEGFLGSDGELITNRQSILKRMMMGGLNMLAIPRAMQRNMHTIPILSRNQSAMLLIMALSTGNGTLVIVLACAERPGMASDFTLLG